MKAEGAKEENEGINMKNCRAQTATASSDVIKIRVRFYFREGGRKWSLIWPKLLQPGLARHSSAHCQMPGVLLFLCRTGNH